MPYFPFFIDIENKPLLIVGGGIVAQRKIEKLLPFKPIISVIAPFFTKEIESNPLLNLIKREYKEGDEEKFNYVIAATNNKAINSLISRRCQDKRILVNVVDDPSLCSFIFPSIVQNGKLSIGISSGGTSPTACIELKNKINELIPDNFDSILDYLYILRNKIKGNIKSEEERHILLKEVFKLCMDKGRALTNEEEAIFLGGKDD